MLIYKVRGNKEKVVGDEIYLDRVYISDDERGITGVADYSYDISDGQKVLVKNTENGSESEMVMNVSIAKCQGWVDYLKPYTLNKDKFSIGYDVSSDDSYIEMYYVVYDGKIYTQDYTTDYNGTQIEYTKYDTISIPKMGKYQIDYDKSYIRILTKYYIYDGIVDIDGTEYSDQMDFYLENHTNKDEDGNYYDYLSVGETSQIINYFPKENYYNIYKCSIYIPEDNNIIDVNKIMCVSPSNYIYYNNTKYEVTQDDYGNDYIYIDETVKQTALSNRTYPDFFYNDDIFPNFESVYSDMMANKEGIEKKTSAIYNLMIKTEYTASTNGTQIFLLTNDRYNFELGGEIIYESLYDTDVILPVENDVDGYVSASSDTNYIFINGVKYKESANSFYSVSINGHDFDIIDYDTTYSDIQNPGNSYTVGYINVSGSNSIVMTNFDGNHVLTSITKSSIVNDRVTPVTYTSITSYGSYTIDDVIYKAGKNLIQFTSADPQKKYYYRGIEYKKHVKGRLLINEVNSENMLRCEPIVDYYMTNDDAEQLKESMCYDLALNYSELKFHAANNVFGTEDGRKSLSLLTFNIKDPEDIEERKIHVFPINTFITLNCPLSNNESSDLSREWSIGQYFINENESENIQNTVDMERDIYYPAKHTSYNTGCTSVTENLSDVDEILFNIHFRTRSTTDNSVINDNGNGFTSACSSYNILDNPIYFGIGNDNYSNVGGVSDLLCYLNFTAKDVFYQKDKISKSFLRLEFYDSPNPNSQNLLFYSTIFMDEKNLFDKYINGITDSSERYMTINDIPRTNGQWGSALTYVSYKINTNTEEVDKKVKKGKYTNISSFKPIINEENRLSAQFSVKNRYDATTSSDGFYLYMFKDYATKLNERSIFLKVEFNNANTGKIIPLCFPRKFYFTDDNGSNVPISHMTIKKADSYELYNPYTLTTWDAHNQISLKTLKSELETDLKTIKAGYELEDIFYQQYIELKVIYDSVKQRYCYYLPFDDENVYPLKENKMILNLWEIKIV